MRFRLDRIAFVLYGPVALALAFGDFYVRRNPAYVVERYIPDVLAGVYEAPFIYRPLAPWLIHSFTSLTGLSPLVAFGITRFVGLLVALIAFHIYLRKWQPAGVCVAATLVMAALLPLTFTNSWPVPGTYLELALFSLGCLAVAARRDWWFAAILIVAAFNRETSAFLFLLWLIARARQWPRTTWFIRATALGAAWLTIFVGIRWLYGFKTYKVFVLAQNLGYLRFFDASIEPRLRVFGWFWLAMLIVPVILAIRGAMNPDTPSVARDAVVVGLLFVATCLTTASIVETRVLVPAFPLFAPAALAFVTASRRGLR